MLTRIVWDICLLNECVKGLVKGGGWKMPLSNVLISVIRWPQGVGLDVAVHELDELRLEVRDPHLARAELAFGVKRPL